MAKKQSKGSKGARRSTLSVTDLAAAAGGSHMAHRAAQQAKTGHKTVQSFKLKKGDNLWNHFGTNYKSVMKENHIKDPRRILAGTQIYYTKGDGFHK